MNKDLKNKKFGRLTVIEEVEVAYRSKWLCQCDCGNQKIIREDALLSGATVSCGCYHKEIVSVKQTTHGESKTRLYHEWQQMKRRCNNPNYKFYPYYGGRGIIICDEWQSDFEAFRAWSLSHGYDDSLTLDRIDSNGNYEPANCRWATRKTQQNNTRRTRLFTINGKTKSIAEWCRIYNAPHERVRRRVINEGWEIEKALTTPPLKRNHVPR